MDDPHVINLSQLINAQPTENEPPDMALPEKTFTISGHWGADAVCAICHRSFTFPPEGQPSLTHPWLGTITPVCVTCVMDWMTR